MKDFRLSYVYQHVRLDKNVPFYIGIGHYYDNDKYKRAYTKSGRNNIWKNITKKTNYSVEIIFENLTWDEACLKEIELIKIYGKIKDKSGVLANILDGGEGIRHSEQTKRKMSISAKKIKRKLSEQHKLNIGKSLKGRTFSEESIQKIINSHKKIKHKKHTIETREKMSKTRKGRVFSLEHRKKLSDAMKNKPKSIEHRKKLSLSLKNNDNRNKNKNKNNGTTEIQISNQ